MTEPRDSETLIDDILAEPEADALRELSLGRTLRLVKRRRVLRRARRVGSALAIVAALGLLGWRLMLPDISGPRPQTPGRPYLLVRTQPLPASALVQTQPLAPADLVTSAPRADVAIVSTRPENRLYQDIDDTTLLALADAGGTNAAVLVRLGPHSAELVFVPATAPSSPELPIR